MKKFEHQIMPHILNSPTEYMIQGRLVPVNFKIRYSIEINGHDEDHMTEQDKLDLAEIWQQAHLQLLQKAPESI